MMRTAPRYAPGLAATLARVGPEPTDLHLRGLRSVRGIEHVRTLEMLDMPVSGDLRRIARLPHLRQLCLSGVGTRRPVDLSPLAEAPALEALRLDAIEAPVVGLEALAQVGTLEVLDVHESRCPDLRPLVGHGLRRIELDGAQRVKPGWLEGLDVEELDLWMTGLRDLEVLATLPRIRELWLVGNPWGNAGMAVGRGRVRPLPSLAPLLALGTLERVVLDGNVDPERHRGAIEALEARGVWVAITSSPEEHGIVPGWWSTEGADLVDDRYRAPLRHVSPGAWPGVQRGSGSHAPAAVV